MVTVIRRIDKSKKFKWLKDIEDKNDGNTKMNAADVPLKTILALDLIVLTAM